QRLTEVEEAQPSGPPSCIDQTLHPTERADIRTTPPLRAGNYGNHRARAALRAGTRCLIFGACSAVQGRLAPPYERESPASTRFRRWAILGSNSPPMNRACGDPV